MRCVVRLYGVVCVIILSPLSHHLHFSLCTHRPAGIIRSHGGLTFLRVFESGHMVRWWGPGSVCPFGPSLASGPPSKTHTNPQTHKIQSGAPRPARGGAGDAQRLHGLGPPGAAALGRECVSQPAKVSSRRAQLPPKTPKTKTHRRPSAMGGPKAPRQRRSLSLLLLPLLPLLPTLPPRPLRLRTATRTRATGRP